MWEFDIIHTVTNEQKIIFGYSLKDAFQRHPSLNPNEWTCEMSTYID